MAAACQGKSARRSGNGDSEIFSIPDIGHLTTWNTCPLKKCTARSLKALPMGFLEVRMASNTVREFLREEAYLTMPHGTGVVQQERNSTHGARMGFVRRRTCLCLVFTALFTLRGCTLMLGAEGPRHIVRCHRGPRRLVLGRWGDGCYRPPARNRLLRRGP